MRNPKQTKVTGNAWRGALLLAAWMAAPAFGQEVNGGNGIMRVEQDWEAVLNEPVQDLTAPQFHTVMSPYGHLDSYHFVTLWNYREDPTFTSGGLMTHAWNGENELASRQFREDPLSNAAETITWTQALKTTGDQLIFRVFNGLSTTWGSFGSTDTRLVLNVSVPSLVEYSTGTTLSESWITYGSNRVSLLRITEVRYYDGYSNLLYKDTTPKVVFQAAQ